MKIRKGQIYEVVFILREAAPSSRLYCFPVVIVIPVQMCVTVGP